MKKILLLLLFYLIFESVSIAADGVIVKVQKATSGDISSTTEYTGLVQPVQTVKIQPEVSAKINKVNFSEGSFVKAGQTLFTLDSSQYNATVSLKKAELSNAEVSLSRAKKYLQRLKAADKRSVPASDMDNAENDVQKANAGIAQAKASLNIAQIDLNRTKITSPISGKIGKADYTKGNYVVPGTTLATVAQVNPIRVAVDIPDSEYFKIKNNDYKAEIKNSDGKLYGFIGSHEFDENYVNSTTGTIRTYWSFENPNNDLISGANIHVLLSLRTPNKGTLIPSIAKLSDSSGNYVYTVQNNTAYRKRITIVEELGNMTAVTGINVGEMVVTDGTQKLYDNAKVSIQE